MATLPTRILEIEFDAGVWTNVTSDYVELSSRRGRNRESGAFETGQLVFTLRNDARKYDPDNAAGPYYGKLRPNRRVRWRNTFDTITSLRLPGTSGAYASTPDSAALSITGDIDIRVKLSLDDWTPAAIQALVAKWGATNSYLLRLETSGALGFFYAPTGGAGTFSSVLGFADGSTKWIRVTLDADNGAGGRTVTFYSSDDGVTWTTINAVTTAGTAAAITDTTEVVAIGSYSNNAFNATGNIYAVEIRNGIGGTVVASPSFDTRAGTSAYTSSTTLVDAQGNVWTRQGTASFPTTSITYPAFLGYIDKIGQVAGGPNDATAVIQVSDFFKLLNRAELPESAYQAEKLQLAPSVWFPLGEPSGSSVVSDVVAGYKADAIGVPGFGGAGLVVRDPGSAMDLTGSFTTGQGVWLKGASYPAALLSGAGPFTIEGWLRHPTVTSIGEAIVWGLIPASGSFNDEVVIFIGGTSSNTGKVGFKVGSAALVYSTVRVDDGAAHHVVCLRNASNECRIYIDGIDRTTAVGTSTLNIAGADIVIGATSWGAGGVNGALQHWAWWKTTALAAADIAALNTAGRTPWNGDTPGTRLARIFELVATPGSYVLDAGEPTLQSTSLGGSVLAYAQKVEETALGLLFVDREGDVTFVGRNSSLTGAYLTSKATLVDDDSGAGIPYRQADADIDEAFIVTRATVSREGSVAATYFDTAARDEFGWLDDTHDGLLHDSDAYSRSYAEWLVNTHRTPGSRVGTVALELTRDPATMYPAILNLEIGDRVTWKRKAQNVGAVTTVDMRVEAISHDTGGHYWRTRLQLSPFNLAASGYPVGVWDVTNWDQSVWGI